MISKSLGSLLYVARCHASLGKNAPGLEDLVPSQRLIISYVVRHPGCIQDSLVETLGFDKSHIAHRLNELEKEGFITRRVDESDARCRRVEPTDKAREMYPAIHGFYEDFADSILQGLTDGEIAELDRLTGILRANAREMMRNMR